MAFAQPPSTLPSGGLAVSTVSAVSYDCGWAVAAIRRQRVKHSDASAKAATAGGK